MPQWATDSDCVNDLFGVMIVVKLINWIYSRAKALQHHSAIVDETDAACGDFSILSGECV